MFVYNNTSLFVVFLAAFILSACATTGGRYGSYGSSNSGYNESTTSKEVNAVTKDEENRTVMVTISNFAFEPVKLTVSSGDSIAFVNEDGAPHTATASDSAFDTGNLVTGDSASVTLTRAGTYDYLCSIHPVMKGTVIVEK